MICENCHKENRGIAKFCKWCGKPLVSQDLLDKLVGLDEVKRQLKTIVDTYAYLRSRKDIVNVRISVNAVIIGETGTGKTALAEILRDYFYQSMMFLVCHDPRPVPDPTPHVNILSADMPAGSFSPLFATINSTISRSSITALRNSMRIA